MFFIMYQAVPSVMLGWVMPFLQLSFGVSVYTVELTQLCPMRQLALPIKAKVKYLGGAFLVEPVTYGTRFSMPLGARLWHYAAELRTLSVPYPLCGSALPDTTDSLSEMCPLKLTAKCMFS